MIVEHVEHRCFTGDDPPRHRVDLPPRVRCRCFEAPPRRSRSFRRLGYHEPAAHQDSMHRRHRRHPPNETVIAAQMPLNRGRPTIVTSIAELLAPRHHRVLDIVTDRTTTVLGSSRAWLEPRRSLVPAPLDVLVKRLARDSALRHHTRHVHRFTRDVRHHRSHRLHRHHPLGHDTSSRPARCHRCCATSTVSDVTKQDTAPHVEIRD